MRPKESRVKPLEEFLRTLYTFLTSLPSHPPSHPLEGARSLLKKGITVPYPIPQPAEGVKWTVAFEKPSDINLVGSWPNKVGVKAASGPTWMVDVALEMPAVCDINCSQPSTSTDCRDRRCSKKRTIWTAASSTNVHFILLR